MGKIVAICNQKGGVGKTTTCINLAACLAELKQRVLVIDLDPQGNSTTGLGVDKGRTLSIYSVISKLVDITDKEVVAETSIPNLFVIPSSSGLEGAEAELATMENKEKVLKNELRKISYNYDYILLDCPPSLSSITVNAFVAANSVIVPIQCEFFALEGLAQLINTIKVIKNFLNKELTIEGVLLTMFDSRSNISSEVAEEVLKNFRNKTYKTIIPRNVKLAEAPSYGQSIIEYDSKSSGAKAYMALAKEFLKANRGKIF